VRGITTELVEGDRGIFEVRADGVVIYSKNECGGRFPTGADIIRRLRGLNRTA
jgi:hypothetical protein